MLNVAEKSIAADTLSVFETLGNTDHPIQFELYKNQYYDMLPQLMPNSAPEAQFS
jgi:hypothetical protein